MEKIQIQAALMITGTNMYASKQLLYLETGWEKLSRRREYHRLVLLYKILNDLAPAHLRNTLLSYTNQNINYYNFRHNNMQLIFFPSSFRLWNELDQTVKNVDSLSLSKSKLKKKTRPHNPYHDLGCRKISCILASIRMQCSKLNHDLSVNNIIENDLCNCGNIETAFHYFVECPPGSTQYSEMIFKWKLCFYQIYH